jgi:hypothetical protein
VERVVDITDGGQQGVVKSDGALYLTDPNLL